MDGGPIDIADLERVAERRLSPGVAAYFNGGAADETTLRGNAEAFAGWRIRPRAMVDLSGATTACEVLGAPASMPIGVAPVAFQKLVHPDGEAGTARAARDAGALMCLSTLANTAPAKLAEAVDGGRRMFQLYCFRDRGVTRDLHRQACESGFEAVVLTVDSPRAGRRERDLRAGFRLPEDVTVPSLRAVLGEDRALDIQQVFGLLDPSLTWRDLEALVAECELPVLVKGVLTREDARLAVEHGAAGVIVSNHGGRQLDRVAPAIDALPEVVEAVGGAVPVLMDGGVRRGTDVFVALAIGAEAVLVGRPAIWGLAHAGSAGVALALEMLRAELEQALALAGCPSPGAVTESHVERVAPRG